MGKFRLILIMVLIATANMFSQPLTFSGDTVFAKAYSGNKFIIKIGCDYAKSLRCVENEFYELNVDYGHYCKYFDGLMECFNISINEDDIANGVSYSFLDIGTKANMDSITKSQIAILESLYGKPVKKKKSLVFAVQHSMGFSYNVLFTRVGKKEGFIISFKINDEKIKTITQ